LCNLGSKKKKLNMINIVHDNLPHANVWSPVKEVKRQNFGPIYKKSLPTFLHYGYELAFFDSADNLDSFIYPVLLHEPYIQVRSLIANHNPFGFWSHVSDDVIEGLREKRGWIIIDIYSEPITQHDFDAVINSLNDSSEFPNDRVLINTTSPHFTKHERVFNYPSFLEMGCVVYQKTHNNFSPCPCGPRPGRPSEVEYPHKRFLLLNAHMDYPVAQVFAKYASEYTDMFLDSSNDVYNSPTWRPSKFLELPEALHATDINVVLEAYVDHEVIEYPFITEKTYRNIKYKKPFIIMGNKYSLLSLRKLGYKTFDPLINESYDTLGTSKHRSKEVLKELNRLSQMNNYEWDDLMIQCKPVLEHNYNNLLKRIKQTKDWLEGLKNL